MQEAQKTQSMINAIPTKQNKTAKKLIPTQIRFKLLKIKDKEKITIQNKDKLYTEEQR